MNEFDDYITTCPLCGGNLSVVSFKFSGSIPLVPSGFATEDASEFNSHAEIVECSFCGFRIDGLPLGSNWIISVVPYLKPDWNQRRPVLRFMAVPIDVDADITDNDSAFIIFDIRIWAENSNEQGLVRLASMLASEHVLLAGAHSFVVQEVEAK